MSNRTIASLQNYYDFVLDYVTSIRQVSCTHSGVSYNSNSPSRPLLSLKHIIRLGGSKYYIFYIFLKKTFFFVFLALWSTCLRRFSPVYNKRFLVTRTEMYAKMQIVVVTTRTPHRPIGRLTLLGLSNILFISVLQETSHLLIGWSKRAGLSNIRRISVSLGTA